MVAEHLLSASTSYTQKLWRPVDIYSVTDSLANSTQGSDTMLHVNMSAEFLHSQHALTFACDLVSQPNRIWHSLLPIYGLLTTGLGTYPYPKSLNGSMPSCSTGRGLVGSSRIIVLVDRNRPVAIPRHRHRFETIPVLAVASPPMGGMSLSFRL